MKPEDKDHLKEFIKSNREAFDSELPSKKVWKGIANSMELSEKSFSTHWLWKAAAIFFFLTSGYLYVQNLEKEVDTNKIAEVTNDEDFVATEKYYVSLISEKRNQVFDYKNKDIEVEGMYEVDIEQLDAMYQVLKAQYEENPAIKLQEAMTLNLLVRIDILNQQLSEIEGAKKQKEQVPELGV